MLMLESGWRVKKDVAMCWLRRKDGCHSTISDDKRRNLFSYLLLELDNFEAVSTILV
jgi:hypothetical protein